MEWHVELTSTLRFMPRDEWQRPPGYLSGAFLGEEDRQRSNWLIDADTANDALAGALRLARDAFGDVDPLKVVVVSVDEQRREWAERGELVNPTEIARILGVSQQRASYLARHDPNFPAGMDTGGGRMVYPRLLVDIYAANRGSGPEVG